MVSVAHPLRLLFGATANARRRTLSCPPPTDMTATWNGTVLAQSDDTVVVEGNHYFPADSLREEHFAPSDHTSRCPWKGLASYKHVVVNGATNENAAWFYPEPKDAAAEIRGHVAFWKGVEVRE